MPGSKQISTDKKISEAKKDMNSSGIVLCISFILMVLIWFIRKKLNLK